MINVLKPCPFCGEAPKETLKESRREGARCFYSIECQNYDCLIFPSIDMHWLKVKKQKAPWFDIEAIKRAWNKRP